MERTQARGRLSHSCLITGGDFEQLLYMAGELAKEAVCLSSLQRPCGHCEGCRKAEEGIHPDIIRLRRPEDDKGQRKAEISVKQIRELAADACVMPNEAARKVYIIEEAETMNAAAQNAALKLLEEPPLDALLLLCSVNPEGLLQTVRSRCTVLSCAHCSKKPPQEDEKAVQLAKAYIKAVAKGSASGLLRWCAQNEDLDSRQMAAFLEAVTGLLTESLEGKSSLEPMKAMSLLALAERCSTYLRSNVSVKHIFGLLAVSSIA